MTSRVLSRRFSRSPRGAEGSGRDAAMKFGHPHLHHRLCDSTSSRARELAAAGAPTGTVVTAAEQQAGRGRQGRAWIAHPGEALLYSAIVRAGPEETALLPLAAAVAVAEAIEMTAPVGCKIKWPNDVWIDGRKCAGILIEARPQDRWAVIGVGINVSTGAGEFPDDLRETATSIGHGSTVSGVLDSLNKRLAAWSGAPDSSVLEAFGRRDALTGHRIEWAGGTGTAEGVDEHGNLVVTSANGDRTALSAGEVHLA